MEWILLIIVLFVVVPAIAKGWGEATQDKTMEELQKTNPELWGRLKQMEHEERQSTREMEQQKHQRLHENIHTGVKIGTWLLGIITKR